ncbi:HtaA domain-containing protein [Leifsonia sp. ZF2019]|uniref:HtaA domain-containing protein n=1 Tax=Leifsonia sp. ZF2019 TaxID=2781978 RepID=UPI001CC0F3E7|nr:HtaA domain-containing protein [Leifsonia sp. ZF2019]UAJ79755.1 HtaA domain-containing protein [Leifsonia sp. ZF2019]
MTASRTATPAPDPERRAARPARRILAAALAGLLAAAGMTAVGATPALAASASVSVAPATGIDADNGTVTVTGSGFTPTGGGVNGVYVGVGPKAALDDSTWFVNASFYQGVKWVSTIAADGSFTSTLTGLKKVFTANGRTVDCSTEECGVFTFAAHGSTDRTQDTYTPIAFAAPQPASTSVALTSSAASVQEGSPVTLTATVSPADVAGTVTFAEGSTTLGSQAVSAGTAAFTSSALGVGTHSITAAFAPADSAAYGGSTSSATTVTVTAAPQPTGPSVTVAPSTGIDPAAGTVTVTGSGFSTTGSGFYIGVGPKSAVDNADWFVKASYYQGVKWATTAGTYGAKINADGTISISLTNLKRVFTSNGASVDCAAVECGVYTFAAHGSADRSQDTYTPIAFAEPKTTTTELSVNATAVQAGRTVTLTATVSPATAGTVEFFDGTTSLGSSTVTDGVASLGTTSLASGARSLTAAFTPSDATVATASTSSASTVTVYGDSDALPVLVSLSVTPATAVEGTELTYTATLSANLEGDDLPTAFPGSIVFGEGGGTSGPDAGSSYGTVSVTGNTAVFRTSTLAVGEHKVRGWYTPADATTFASARSNSITATVTAKPVTPGVPTVSVPQVPAGGGTVTVTGSGFSTASPGIYLALGPAGLRGFYQDSARLIPSQTVWIAVGNPSVPSGTTRTAPLNADGTFAVDITVPAPDAITPAYAVYTSKAHGQGLVDTTQDTNTPVAFASSGTAVTPTVTVSTSSGTGNTGDPVDVTVRVTPAAEGTIAILDNGKVVASGLRLVADTVAPASGVVTFAALAAASSSSVTARVPGLASGTHAFSASFTPDDPTLFTPVVSPSVDVVIAPAAAVTPQAPAPVAAVQPTCVARAVGDATLDWGVKTSFRNYISGGIANGSWTLSGVTYAGGQYGWSGGKGSFNPDETRGLVRYSGSVSFTGHDGVLNLVLSNLATRVTSATQATLIADVHSTDMSGNPSDYSGVSFATIALGGGTASGSTFAVDGAATALTADGAKAFAGFYNAGDALDPISFRFPLGGEVECDSTTASSLASTGSTGSAAVPLLGGLLILAGVAAVAAMRRRSVRADVEAV